MNWLRRSIVSGVLLVVAITAAPTLALAQERELEPVGKLTPPPGWQQDVGRSRGLELLLGREDHFGGVEVLVSAQHLRAPQAGGILLTSEIATVALPPDPALAASTELHGVRAGLDALGDGVKVARWDIAPDPSTRVTDGLLEWSDASLGTTTISRTLVFQTGGRLVRLTAECIIAADAGALRAPCEAALRTLAPLADVGAREPLTVSATPPGATANAAAAPPPPEGELPTSSGPTIREREGDMPVTIVVDKPKSKTDMRPYYLFGGLVVILAVYLLNRRARERLDQKAESKPESKDESP